MGRAGKHRLVLIDRGHEHRHRWHATCTCGWVGQFRRRKHDAEQIYRMHVTGETHGRDRRAAALSNDRREPTPAEVLPAELR